MTHKSITVPFLRRAMARELGELRNTKNKVKMDKETFSTLRFGIESGIWAVQKEMFRC